MAATGARKRRRRMSPALTNKNAAGGAAGLTKQGKSLKYAEISVRQSRPTPRLHRDHGTLHTHTPHHPPCGRSSYRTSRAPLRLTPRGRRRRRRRRLLRRSYYYYIIVLTTCSYTAYVSVCMCVVICMYDVHNYTRNASTRACVLSSTLGRMYGRGFRSRLSTLESPKEDAGDGYWMEISIHSLGQTQNPRQTSLLLPVFSPGTR